MPAPTAGDPQPGTEPDGMGRIDPRVVRAARLAGAALFAVGAFDVVLRANDLSRDQRGAILLAAGLALLALHVALVRFGHGRREDALLAAVLAVPFVPAGIAVLAFNPHDTPDTDILKPFREAVSEGLIIAGILFGVAYFLTRQPRWTLVAALAVAFGAELLSSSAALGPLLAPISVVGSGSGSSWTPTVILAACAAIAAGGAAFSSTPTGAERRNLFVAASVMLAFAAANRAFTSGGDAGRDLFLAAVLAAQLGIAWWRTTPAVGVAAAFTAAVLAFSLSQRSGWVGVAVALVGAAIAGGATVWGRGSPGGGPAAEPPASAA